MSANDLKTYNEYRSTNIIALFNVFSSVFRDSISRNTRKDALSEDSRKHDSFIRRAKNTSFSSN